MPNDSFTKNGKILLAIGLLAPFISSLLFTLLNPTMTENKFVSFLLSDSLFHSRFSGRMPWFLLLTGVLTCLFVFFTPLRKHTGDAFAIALVTVEVLIFLLVLI